jgi:hypothetical protein
MLLRMFMREKNKRTTEQKGKKEKNIQQQVFAGGHPPNY